MIMLPDNLQYVVLGINFVVTAVLIVYSLYLYRIERSLRQKFHSINTKAANIIEDANHKALHMLNRSEYISDKMKNHAEKTFDHILEDLKNENRSFYKSLEKTYFDKSTQMMREIQESESNDMKEFSESMAKTSSEAKISMEKKLESDYEEAKADINKFKDMKKKEFEAGLKVKIAEITGKVLPQYFKVEDQEKFAKEVIEKAASEGFFN